jgi:hypothetical protein
MFPNLIKELEDGENKVTIDAVRADAAKAEVEVHNSDEVLRLETEEALPDKFRHYNPTVVDFIRRCDTVPQAEEIIEYMHRRGEITEEYACQLKEQLKEQGIRSFGSKKEDDYYFKQGGLC